MQAHDLEHEEKNEKNDFLLNLSREIMVNLQE